MWKKKEKEVVEGMSCVKVCGRRVDPWRTDACGAEGFWVGQGLGQ